MIWPPRSGIRPSTARPRTTRPASLACSRSWRARRPQCLLKLCVWRYPISSAPFRSFWTKRFNNIVPTSRAVRVQSTVRQVLQPPDILRRPDHRVDHVNLFLANVFFFFALLPFLSPLPSESDVQLPAFIIAFIIVARDVLKGRFTLNWVGGVFLSIAIWSFAFVLPWNPFFVRQRVGMGAAFLVYYVVKKYSARFSTRVLMVVVSITLVSTLVQLMFPNVYETVASLFVRTVKNLGQGGRGASGPSAEPSFLAGMALVH